MAKDEKGHGSEGRGSAPRSSYFAGGGSIAALEEQAKAEDAHKAELGSMHGSNSGEAHVASIASAHGIDTSHLSPRITDSVHMTGSGLPPPHSSTPSMRHGPVPEPGPRFNAWGQTASTAKAVRSQLRQARKQRSFNKSGRSLP